MPFPAMKFFHKLALSFSVLSLSACIGEVENLPYEYPAGKAAATNGYWDLTLTDEESDDATDAEVVRVLVYEGQVYGMNEEYGYLGSLDFNTYNDTLEITLKRYAVLDYYNSKLASAAPTLGTLEISGSLELPSTEEETETDTTDSETTEDTTAITSPTITGTYEISAETGAVSMVDDGTWKNGSLLQTIVGTWVDDDDRLYITAVSDEEVSFLARDVSGCETSGTMSLIDSEEPVLATRVSSRSGCNSLNYTQDGSTIIRGYSAVNAAAEMEIFLYRKEELLHMSFSRP